MDIQLVVEQYREQYSRYERAAECVTDIVSQIATHANINARVSGRVKDPLSFQKKAIVKGYADPWRMITDKVGVRAIVDEARGVDDLTGALEMSTHIEVLSVEDKRQVIDPGKLAYSGVHVQVVAPSEEGDTEPIECEVQLRTSAQDVWSIVSHRLLYKPLLDLPQEHQHSIYRLVALVELFDQEVQRISDALPKLPGYETVDLIEAAEHEFLPLVGAASDREFSAFILSKIQAAIGSEERPAYAQILRDYVSSTTDRLKRIYEDYGPHSPMAAVPAYAMFSQAESLIILERLSLYPHRLKDAWRDAGLSMDILMPLLTALGIFLYPDE